MAGTFKFIKDLTVSLAKAVASEGRSGGGGSNQFKKTKETAAPTPTAPKTSDNDKTTSFKIAAYKDIYDVKDDVKLDMIGSGLQDQSTGKFYDDIKNDDKGFYQINQTFAYIAGEIVKTNNNFEKLNTFAKKINTASQKSFSKVTDKINETLTNVDKSFLDVNRKVSGLKSRLETFDNKLRYIYEKMDANEKMRNSQIKGYDKLAPPVVQQKNEEGGLLSTAANVATGIGAAKVATSAVSGTARTVGSTARALGGVATRVGGALLTAGTAGLEIVGGMSLGTGAAVLAGAAAIGAAGYLGYEWYRTHGELPEETRKRWMKEGFTFTEKLRYGGTFDDPNVKRNALAQLDKADKDLKNDLKKEKEQKQKPFRQEFHKQKNYKEVMGKLVSVDGHEPTEEDYQDYLEVKKELKRSERLMRGFLDDDDEEDDAPITYRSKGAEFDEEFNSKKPKVKQANNNFLGPSQSANQSGGGLLDKIMGWMGMGSKNQSSFGMNYDRQKIEEQKAQFLKFGELPQGFEFLMGNKGRLGSPMAVAAGGAMPLGGGGGFGIPSGSFGGGGGFGGGGFGEGGDNQENSGPTGESSGETLSSINPHQLAFIRGIGRTESDFSKKEAYSESYNQASNNANVRKYGAKGADYGYYQTNGFDVEEAIKLGVDPEIAKHLNGGGQGGKSTLEQQTLAMHEYISKKYPREYAALKSGDPDAFEAARKKMQGHWFGLKDHPERARQEFAKGATGNFKDIFSEFKEKPDVQQVSYNKDDEIEQGDYGKPKPLENAKPKTLEQMASQRGLDETPKPLDPDQRKAEANPDKVIADAANGKLPPTSRAVQYALSMKGLSENNPRDRQALMKYMRGEKIDPQQTAWCAAFLNASMRQAGIKGAGNAAGSWHKWGEGVKDFTKVKGGDVLVNYKYSSGTGMMGNHVIMIAGEPFKDKNGQWVVPTVQGNSSDMVKKGTMPLSQLKSGAWDIRRATEKEYMNEGEFQPNNTPTDPRDKDVTAVKEKNPFAIPTQKEMMKQSMEASGIGTRGGGAGIASSMMQTNDEQVAKVQESNVKQEQQRLRERSALGVDENTEIQRETKNVSQNGAISGGRDFISAEKAQNGAITRVEAEAPEPPHEAPKEREKQVMNAEGGMTTETPESTAAETAAQNDQGDYGGGGQYNPESQPAEPGCGGYGSYGRCFV